MSFRNRVKNRRINKYLITFINLFKFRSLNLATSGKIILFGIIIIFISLFFPWVDSIDGQLSENAFSVKSGGVGIIILFIITFILFNLFSINSKEKIKLHLGVHFKDYPVCITLGFFMLILGIVSINFINALQSFSKIVIYGNGIILSLSGSIVIIIGGIIQKMEFNKFSRSGRMYDCENGNIDDSPEETKENNMKLPF